jgi:hypothetical protein
MPNAQVHAAIGTASGGLVAFLCSSDLSPEARLTITLSGAYGGYVGGCAPDVLEPAIHAWHRSFFHSAVAGAGVFQTANVPVREWVQNLLTKSAAIRQRRLEPGADHPDHATLWLQEFGLYTLCGFLIGLPVGYLSHLIADAGTERGLPFIGR